MRRWMWRFTVASCLACLGGQAHADAMSEAKAVGQGSISTINTGMRQSNADWTAPAVTSLPGGAMPQSSASGAAYGGADMANQCAANPGYGVECEAINAAAASMRPAEDYESALSGYTDVQRLQSGQMAFGTALGGQGIDGTYSDCTTKTVTKGQQYYDEQYCHNYYLRVLDQPCTKTLDVNILCESRVVPRIQAATSWNWCAGCAYNRDGQWSKYAEQVTALLGALGNETQFLGSYTQGDYWGVVGTGGLPVTFKVNGRLYGSGSSFWYYHIARVCEPGTPYCGTDYGICVNNSPTFQKTGCTGAINDSMVDLNGQGDCPKPVWRPPTEDYAGHYYCPGSTNISCPSGSTPQVIDGNTACIGTLSCHEEDTWQNSCIDFEARVPPGQLPPDGVNPDGDSVPYPIATAPGSTNFKCERSTSVCTQPEETRVVSGVEVTRSCWQYENTFSCLNEDPKSDCDQPRSGECTETGTTCIDQDGDFCTAEKKTFKCMIEDTTHEETVTDCESQVFQENASGVTWDASYAADNDLASVVAYMEAGREAGGYLDPDSLEIFKGYTSRCRKKLFGLINCCNKGGSSSGSMFSNAAIAAASVGGKALVSTYTYDALFASQAPDMVISGFSAVFGSGSSSALAGMLAGDVTVEGFLSSLIPGPWTIAMMALQFSGLLECTDKDKETALRRDAKLCVDLGHYCSKKLPIIGTCLERTYSYCCFNSVLAKLINTQGKAQIGKTMGTAKHPDCGGFSPEELQTLDLSGMDLSEFIDQIKPPASLVPDTPCYFSGDTSCTSAH